MRGSRGWGCCLRRVAPGASLQRRANAGGRWRCADFRRKAQPGPQHPRRGPGTFPLKTAAQCPTFYEGFPFLRHFSTAFPNVSQFICLGCPFIADNSASRPPGSREGSTDPASICWAAGVCRAPLSPTALGSRLLKSWAGEAGGPRFCSCPWQPAVGYAAAPGKLLHLKKLRFPYL